MKYRSTQTETSTIFSNKLQKLTLQVWGSVQYSSPFKKQICTAMIFAIFVLSTIYNVLISDPLTQTKNGSKENYKNKSCSDSGERNHEKILLSWDTSGPNHSFWPEDQQCSQFGTKFVTKNSLPPHALVSYPGSGFKHTNFD